MPDLQWKESDSVGIASLDAQHQGLFATARRLRDAIRDGRAVSIQQEILAELGAHSRAHSNREERVMETAKFPAFDSHQQIHRAFLDRLQEIQSELRYAQRGLSPEHMEFLRAWLRQHVAIEDARYGAWISRREFPKPAGSALKLSPGQETQQCHF